MNEEPTVEDKEIDINDPRLPDALREHGKLFKKPARWVIDLGNGEYLLYAEDFELLDAVYNCF
ncbi:MAG: hypothetical protein KJ725_14105 [Gammaproteobacteria bacterium]|nr:hypothetical protein [Gammaproteobacteria bacterium]